MTKKDVKKTREQANPKVCIHFSSRETAVLDAMMKKEDWENVSGFIKNKVFGDSVNSKYERLLKAKKKEDVVIVLKNNFHDLTNKINYTNFRFDYELEQFEKRIGESRLDKKLADDYLSTMKKYILVTKTKIDEYLSDAELILRNMDIIVERAKAKNDLTMLPDYVVFKALKGDDFNSPIAQEGARRLYIGHEMDNEELERRRIAREAKEKEEAEKAKNEKEKKQS